MVALLPNAARAYVEPAKLRDYALDPTSPTGRHKARVFRSALGFERDDWPALADALVAGARSAEVTGRRDAPAGGPIYELLISVTGVNGRSATVATAWQVGPDGDPRLVTAYVHG